MTISDPDKIWPELDEIGTEEVRKRLSMGVYAKSKIPLIEEWLRQTESNKEDQLNNIGTEKSILTSVPKDTRVDRSLKSIKNHPTLSVLILISMTIIAAGSLTDAISKLQKVIVNMTQSKGVSVQELFVTLEDTTKSEQERLHALDILRSDYGWTDYKGRNLSYLRFPPEGWKNIDFTEAILTESSLRRTNLQSIILVRSDLTNADLQNSDLNDAKLNGCICRGTNFQGAKLEDIMLRGGIYDNSNFASARLRDAWLQAASFINTNFSDADLLGANFNIGDPDSETANWISSNLTGAVFDRADIRNADLRNTIGIDAARFREAKYNRNTKFPEEFDPVTRGMIFDPS